MREDLNNSLLKQKMAEKEVKAEMTKNNKQPKKGILPLRSLRQKKNVESHTEGKQPKVATVKAETKDALISPQKARLVADLVRGMKVTAALDILALTQKKAAGIIRKVILAGVANAETNRGLDKKDLVLSRILVDEGVKFPRYRIVSRGQGHRYIKRRSRIRVELTQKNNR